MSVVHTGLGDLLRLNRFNGVELFSVKDAIYNMYEEGGTTFVVFRLEAPDAVQTLEDTEGLNGSPFWELVWRTPSAASLQLIPGVIIEIPAGYDTEHEENITNFYYVSHERTENNRIEVLEASERMLRTRIAGETIDVNYYDGSKPPTRLEVETDFRRDPSLHRSFV